MSNWRYFWATVYKTTQQLSVIHVGRRAKRKNTARARLHKRRLYNNGGDCSTDSVLNNATKALQESNLLRNKSRKRSLLQAFHNTTKKFKLFLIQSAQPFSTLKRVILLWQWLSYFLLSLKFLKKTSSVEAVPQHSSRATLLWKLKVVLHLIQWFVLGTTSLPKCDYMKRLPHNQHFFFHNIHETKMNANSLN